MITLEKVSKQFPRNEGAPRTVLAELDLTIPEGQFACVTGPSGCGKTTLLNLIAGFIAPTSGRILIDDAPVDSPGPDRGVVFQDANLFPWLTVKENVQFGLKLQGVRGARLAEIASRHLEDMGLINQAGQYPYSLSGGMRQRVAIARVLALGPRILLMDEPFSALDGNTRSRLQDKLLEVCSGTRTVVYVTHSIDEAAYLADRVIIMGEERGDIVADIGVPSDSHRNRRGSAVQAVKKQLHQIMISLPLPCPGHHH